MRSLFRVEVRFTGITVSAAREILEKMPIDAGVSARGSWEIINDHDATMVMMGNEFYWGQRRREPSEFPKYEYAVKLVTPLISLGSNIELTELRRIMDQLFEAGAVVTSAECIKVHFLMSGFSRKAMGKVLKSILGGNKLLYTVLFFPNLMAPVCLPARYRFDEGNDQFKDLRTEVYKNYRQIIGGIIASDSEGLIEKLLWELLREKLFPHFNEPDYGEMEMPSEN